MSNVTGNDAAIDKIRKLLALANSRGATEAEAQLAASRAAEIMETYGLEMAQIELSGGSGEQRIKDKASVVGLGREEWTKGLMEAVAESFFVTPLMHYPHDGFTLIGRKSAVISTQLMFQYLYRTVIRLSRKEQGSQRFFRFGCAERIAERISDRHLRILAEQRKQSEERRGPTHNALVVVLEDYEQSERDANNDLRFERAPGTTRAKHLESRALQEKRTQRSKELEAQGIAASIVFWMVYYDLTQEQAIKRQAEYEKDLSAFKTKPYRDPNERRRSSQSYAAGRNAGNDVGLDPQVSNNTTRRLT